MVLNPQTKFRPPTRILPLDDQTTIDGFAYNNSLLATADLVMKLSFHNIAVGLPIVAVVAGVATFYWKTRGLTDAEIAEVNHVLTNAKILRGTFHGLTWTVSCDEEPVQRVLTRIRQIVQRGEFDLREETAYLATIEIESADGRKFEFHIWGDELEIYGKWLYADDAPNLWFDVFNSPVKKTAN